MDDKDSVWNAFLEMMHNQDGRANLTLSELKKAVADQGLEGGDDEDENDDDDMEGEDGQESK